ALRWIQKYISAFGGDPEKVMIWGESAGATSVALQMQTNAGDTEGLFRAAFLESGTPIATGHVDNPYLQSIYDEIVADSGCANATVALECLRTVPAEVLKAAMDKTPSFVSFRQLNIPWFPRADGTFIPRPSQQLLLDGPIANVPFIVGNDVDEGTIVSFGTLNVTTDDEFLDYIHSNYYRNTSRAAVAKILDLYPSDPAAGSPFNTGDKYAYSPQFKRMSAFQGDFFGQAPRRLFVQHLAEKQPVYSYLSNYHTVDGIGAAHGMELADVFGGGPLGDYLIRFAATLDPNGDGAFHWPRYTTSAPLLLTLNDPAPALNLTTDTSHGDEAFEWPHYPLLTLNDTVPALNLTEDTYRAEQMAYLTKLSLADPM
ncbi:alpha/beta-hydrolase, partial [Polyporus arcularius HHB13444]